MNPTDAWAVLGVDGESVIAATGSNTNVQIILEKLTGKTWDQLEAQGCRCIPVTITESAP